MDEPNAQEQKLKKWGSQRGTSFRALSSSYAGTGQITTGTSDIQEPSVEHKQFDEAESYDANYNQAYDYEPETEYQEEPPPQQPPASHKRTGIISSTIHYKKPDIDDEDERFRQPRPQVAARTQPIAADPANESMQRKKKKALTDEEKQVRMDNLADNLAEKFVTWYAGVTKITGLLRKDGKLRHKLQILVASNPELFRRIKVFLDTVLRPLRPFFQLVARVRNKLVERNLISPPTASGQTSQQGDENMPQKAPPEKISFLDLAEKNIIFCDNRKRPLYTLEQLRGKHGYTASEEVVAPMIFSQVLSAFQEVAPKARAIPTPETGMYAGIPMEEVMANVTAEEVMMFLNYVKKFPRGYVGKNFRITESFAGWVVSGTPDD